MTNPIPANLNAVPENFDDPGQVIIVGAGIGGLIAAIECAAKGLSVVVLEQQSGAGGKLRAVSINDQLLDAGPTVFTMREVFDETFERAGTSLENHLTLTPAHILARHAWNAEQRLDLFADRERSIQAIAQFSGLAESKRYARFCRQSERMYETLDATFMRAPRGSPIDLARRVGWRNVGSLMAIKPFSTLWGELSRYFHDPRLQQLFGRYATYSGSSPFNAPATLMLIAHAEARGVWMVKGGMHRLASALVSLGEQLGVRYRFDTRVTRLATQAGRVHAVEVANESRYACAGVIVNTDISALAEGLLGPDVVRTTRAVKPAQRSLSAVTWNTLAVSHGFELARHNVFFSNAYRSEFDDISRQQRCPQNPTVYVCAQDRDDDQAAPTDTERLFFLVNAPANGDRVTYDDATVHQVQTAMMRRLSACGLSVSLEPARTVTTTPNHFSERYASTGGALYGRASHGWRASFVRPGARSAIKGLYLASGSAHPGAGVPMAAISGQLAARSLLQDM